MLSYLTYTRGILTSLSVSIFPLKHVHSMAEASNPVYHLYALLQIILEAGLG